MVRYYSALKSIFVKLGQNPNLEIDFKKYFDSEVRKFYPYHKDSFYRTNVELCLRHLEFFRSEILPHIKEVCTINSPIPFTIGGYIVNGSFSFIYINKKGKKVFCYWMFSKATASPNAVTCTKEILSHLVKVNYGAKPSQIHLVSFPERKIYNDCKSKKSVHKELIDTLTLYHQIMNMKSAA